MRAGIIKVPYYVIELIFGRLAPATIGHRSNDKSDDIAGNTVPEIYQAASGN